MTYPPKEGSLPITQVTLSQLGGSASGIWEVTAVGSIWLSISTPGAGATITSPVLVKGSGPQFEHQIGSVSLLDQQAVSADPAEGDHCGPSNISPPSPFSCKIIDTSRFQHGAQERLIKLVHTGGSASNTGVVIVRVLVGS